MEKKKNGIQQSLVEAYQAIAPYASAGWVFAVSVIVSIALGWWFDGRIGTRPVFTLCGAVFGIGVGIYNLILLTRQTDKKTDKKSKKENEV